MRQRVAAPPGRGSGAGGTGARRRPGPARRPWLRRTRCSSIRARTSERVIRPPSPVPRISDGSSPVLVEKPADHRREDGIAGPAAPFTASAGCRRAGAGGAEPAARAPRGGGGRRRGGRRCGRRRRPPVRHAVAVPVPAAARRGAGAVGAGGRGWGGRPVAGVARRRRRASAVGGDAPVAGAAAPSETTARTVPTSTVSPSGTRISARTPAAGEGTSESTLSVETSKRGSSRAIGLPHRLQPLGHRALGDRFAELRHQDISQGATPCPSGPGRSPRTTRRGSDGAGRTGRSRPGWPPS